MYMCIYIYVNDVFCIYIYVCIYIYMYKHISVSYLFMCICVYMCTTVKNHKLLFLDFFYIDSMTFNDDGNYVGVSR